MLKYRGKEKDQWTQELKNAAKNGRSLLTIKNSISGKLALVASNTRIKTDL